MLFYLTYLVATWALHLCLDGLQEFVFCLAYGIIIRELANLVLVILIVKQLPCEQQYGLASWISVSFWYIELAKVLALCRLAFLIYFIELEVKMIVVL